MSGVAESLQVALGHHQAGRLVEAEEIYRQGLTIEPDNADCLHLLGLVAHQRGQDGDAIALIERAVAFEPGHVVAHNNLGLALQRAGRLPEAIVSYRKAVFLRPDLAELHNNLGLALKAANDLAGAAASFAQAAAISPAWADVHLNFGAVLIDQGKAAEAAMSFAQAAALRPDRADAHNNLGLAFQQQGKLAEALASFERALTINPNSADAHNNCGRALQEQGRPPEAIICFERALAIRPDMAEAHNNLGLAFKEQGHLVQAVAHFERALALAPKLAAARVNLGIALQEQGRSDEAIALFKQVLAQTPDMAEAHVALGFALQDIGRTDDALVSYARALALKPDLAEARLAFCVGQISPFYLQEGEIDRRRADFRGQLELLDNDIGKTISARELGKSIGSSQPFYLAYQGRDDRELLSLYGSLVCRVMAEAYPAPVLTGPPAPDEKVRVGIVSGFFRRHSNWKMPIKGWLTQLDRQRFSLFGYHTGSDRDAETEAAAALCDRFVQGPLSVDIWRKKILADAPHVLIYPEIGMDPMAVKLAAQRLARIQCNSWGHPDTSGLPTLDYYLGSDLMEPPGGEAYYTERLIRLPNLSVFYEPIDAVPEPISRAELGLRDTATVYWCGQSLFKYLPQYDEVFPRIAKAVGDCQFVFIEFAKLPHVTDMFRRRLGAAFTRAGLDADRYCVFLPRLDQRGFIGASGACDVFLDSIGWSGCNSTLESLPHDLPIVAMEGTLMRGRHSAAILRMMGMTDTIAGSIDAYVSIAVRLAHDLPWRAAVKEQISSHKHVLYRDRACISALEEFLDRVARNPAAAEKYSN